MGGGGPFRPHLVALVAVDVDVREEAELVLAEAVEVAAVDVLEGDAELLELRQVPGLRDADVPERVAVRRQVGGAQAPGLPFAAQVPRGAGDEPVARADVADDGADAVAQVVGGQNEVVAGFVGALEVVPGELVAEIELGEAAERAAQAEVDVRAQPLDVLRGRLDAFPVEHVLAGERQREDVDAGIPAGTEQARVRDVGENERPGDEQVGLRARAAPVEGQPVHPAQRQRAVLGLVVEGAAEQEHPRLVVLLDHPFAGLLVELQVAETHLRVAHHRRLGCQRGVAANVEVGRVDGDPGQFDLPFDDRRRVQDREQLLADDPGRQPVGRPLPRRGLAGRVHGRVEGGLVVGQHVAGQAQLNRARLHPRVELAVHPDRAAKQAAAFGQGLGRLEVDDPGVAALDRRRAPQPVAVLPGEGDLGRHRRRLLGLDQGDLGDPLAPPADAVDVEVVPGPVEAGALAEEEGTLEGRVDRLDAGAELEPERGRVRRAVVGDPA